MHLRELGIIARSNIWSARATLHIELNGPARHNAPNIVAAETLPPVDCRYALRKSIMSPA